MLIGEIFGKKIKILKVGCENLAFGIAKSWPSNLGKLGDRGKNNGIVNAWLSSSLKISSLEQISFLEKLLNFILPVGKYAHEITKNLLFLEKLENGWKLYGKTGSGVLLSPGKTKKTEIQHGWFIGWIEKASRKIIFSNHITDNKREKTFASLRAWTETKERLIKIISQKL